MYRIKHEKARDINHERPDVQRCTKTPHPCLIAEVWLFFSGEEDIRLDQHIFRPGQNTEYTQEVDIPKRAQPNERNKIARVPKRSSTSRAILEIDPDSDDRTLSTSPISGGK
jgi:hypothetical protein